MSSESQAGVSASTGAHTGILFGQIAVVVGVAVGGVWGATQWTAHALGNQARLGAAWFDVAGVPIYEPWKLFEWWYFYDAYAPDVFQRGGVIAASSGMLATGAAIGMAVWRSRLARRVTAYGSARWADREEIEKADALQTLGYVATLCASRSQGMAPGLRRAGQSAGLLRGVRFLWAWRRQAMRSRLNSPTGMGHTCAPHRR